MGLSRAWGPKWCSRRMVVPAGERQRKAAIPGGAAALPGPCPWDLPGPSGPAGDPAKPKRFIKTIPRLGVPLSPRGARGSGGRGGLVPLRDTSPGYACGLCPGARRGSLRGPHRGAAAETPVCGYCRLRAGGSAVPRVCVCARSCLGHTGVSVCLCVCRAYVSVSLLLMSVSAVLVSKCLSRLCLSVLLMSVSVLLMSVYLLCLCQCV